MVRRNKKIFQIRAKTVLKIKWSVKTPRHERMELARSRLWAPANTTISHSKSITVDIDIKKVNITAHNYCLQVRTTYSFLVLL